MRKITNVIVALTVSAAAITAFASPSFAQKRIHRATQQTEFQAPKVSTDGFPIPGYVANSPNNNWTDEGYGRYSLGDN